MLRAAIRGAFYALLVAGALTLLGIGGGLLTVAALAAGAVGGATTRERKET